ncbi:hypothetical protein ACH5RR_041060 [Cinchona calisaya]|uniref:RNase H type-1 domain-containing protein n=1 Tax=Cinchona calisaya TaxID=153742 RepID=A0ABD2XTG2_9GENT
MLNLSNRDLQERDSRGIILSTAGKGWHGSHKQLLLEAEAIRDALVNANAPGLNKIEVIPHKGLISKINIRDSNDLFLTILLEDIIHISEMLPWCSFTWLPKSCNLKVDRLDDFASDLLYMIVE